MKCVWVREARICCHCCPFVFLDGEEVSTYAHDLPWCVNTALPMIAPDISWLLYCAFGWFLLFPRYWSLAVILPIVGKNGVSQHDELWDRYAEETGRTYWTEVTILGSRFTEIDGCLFPTIYFTLLSLGGIRRPENVFSLTHITGWGIVDNGNPPGHNSMVFQLWRSNTWRNKSYLTLLLNSSPIMAGLD